MTNSAQPATETHLLKLQEAKCPTCGGKKEVKSAWLDFNLWDTKPCPDCQATGFRNLGLRQRCPCPILLTQRITEQPAFWFAQGGGCKGCWDTKAHNECGNCHGSTITLPPEAELTGVLMDWALRRYEAHFVPMGEYIHCKLVSHQENIWPSQEGDGETPPAALAAAAVLAQGLQ